MTLRRATPEDLAAVVALQRAAYAPNRVRLGVEPLPLQADYAGIFQTMEVWLADAPTAGAEGKPGVAGVLILEPHPDHMLIWSIATDPGRQARGLGHTLLVAAEGKARAFGLPMMRLYTGTVFKHLVSWYARNGYVTERVEEWPDRSVTFMAKPLV